MSFTKHQVLTAVVVGYLAVLSSIQLTWPTALVEVFQTEATPLSRPASPVEASLVSSASSIGALIGMPLFAYLLDAIGRRKTTIVCGVPLVLAWAILTFTDSVEAVIAALLLSGLPLGGLIVGFVFVSEISVVHLRGTLTGIPVMGYSIGVLISYVLGGYLPYKVVLYINLSLSVLYLIFVQFIQESPVYLLMENNEKGALTALARYRSLPENNKQVLDEFYELKLSVHLDREHKADVKAAASPEQQQLKPEESAAPRPAAQSAIKILLQSRPALRALTVCLVLVTSSVFMGMAAVMVYADLLFRSAVPTLSPTVCAILLAVSMILSSVFSASYSDRLGRKILMLWSCALSGSCMLVLATQIHLNWGPPWISVAAVFIYTFVYNFGAGLIPMVIVGEMFVAEVRALCTSIVLELSFLQSFVLLFVFSALVKTLTLHGVFYLFAAICWLTVLYVLREMPETKGLAPQEIQPFFSDGTRRKPIKKFEKNGY